MSEKNYQIIASYVKDLSFEIPSPDCFIDAAQNLDKYETKVDISNKPLKNGMLELNCKTKSDVSNRSRFLIIKRNEH